VTPLVPLIALAPLVVFYLWMFADMTGNPLLSDNERYTWMLTFLFLNVFAAGWYFVEYKYRG
jgi:hypothetical protein